MNLDSKKQLNIVREHFHGLLQKDEEQLTDSEINSIIKYFEFELEKINSILQIREFIKELKCTKF